MKRLTLSLMYGLIAVLGLIWAVGCSTSSSGPTQNVQYNLQLSMTRPSLHNGDPDTVVCFVQDYQNNILQGAQLKFSTRSLNPSQSNLTTAAISDTARPTGTNPTVLYNPISVPDTFDYIYAALLTDDLQDTLVLDSVYVEILP